MFHCFLYPVMALIHHTCSVSLLYWHVEPQTGSVKSTWGRTEGSEEVACTFPAF